MEANHVILRLSIAARAEVQPSGDDGLKSSCPNLTKPVADPPRWNFLAIAPLQIKNISK
jgi:hypothetical protein